MLLQGCRFGLIKKALPGRYASRQVVAIKEPWFFRRHAAPGVSSAKIAKTA